MLYLQSQADIAASLSLWKCSLGSTTGIPKHIDAPGSASGTPAL